MTDPLLALHIGTAAHIARDSSAHPSPWPSDKERHTPPPGPLRWSVEVCISTSDVPAMIAALTQFALLWQLPVTLESAVSDDDPRLSGIYAFCERRHADLLAAFAFGWRSRLSALLQPPHNG